MQNNNNTNSDKLPSQTTNGATRQAVISDERNSEAAYQKQPLKFRPKAGRAQRDPIGAACYFGFCHPAAKIKRERIDFHTGRPLVIGAVPVPASKAAPRRHLPVLWRADPAMTPPSSASCAPPPLK